VSFEDDFDDFDEGDSDLGDIEDEIESNFEDWDSEMWDDIADEYYDLDVFEWFTELS
jgi:hypothetical protein